jgi:hypothetical protein
MKRGIDSDLSKVVRVARRRFALPRDVTSAASRSGGKYLLRFRAAVERCVVVVLETVLLRLG